MVGRALFWRAPVTAVLFASWIVATSHCAFAAAAATDAARSAVENSADECPMHAAAKTTPKPDKDKGCGDLPCCKNLFASFPAVAKALVKPVCGDFTAADFVPYAPGLQRCISCKLPAILGTGPPGPNNFTESVLQRSILAHAPPDSLS